MFAAVIASAFVGGCSRRPDFEQMIEQLKLAESETQESESVDGKVLRTLNVAEAVTFLVATQHDVESCQVNSEKITPDYLFQEFGEPDEDRKPNSYESYADSAVKVIRYEWMLFFYDDSNQLVLIGQDKSARREYESR